jgi:hypothetical protein
MFKYFNIKLKTYLKKHARNNLHASSKAKARGLWKFGNRDFRNRKERHYDMKTGSGGEIKPFEK